MASSDATFAGSIPSIYDRHMGPLYFQPYAAEVARRVAGWQPDRLLETAAGTGIVTAAIAHASPGTRITATDLNPDMLSVAKRRLSSAPNVRTQMADMQSLPFEDGSFDAVVCQFGIMFVPDKVRAHAEARRVLAPGGRYLLVIWDRLEKNPVAQCVHDTISGMFPDDPPQFVGRTPFGYGDPAAIEHDLMAAGFTDIEFETVALDSSPDATAEDASLGLVEGSPLRAELEARGDGWLEKAEAAVRKALTANFSRALSAHVVTARR
ncbi:methyltransferase domain-containing protein [Sphingomonas sp. KRR8]|uniref:class I SAM-dependent methyltransferase n=1 Tax=Sphingomonas sp. KRR8 TaxID=2942996 RepID=UPI002021CA52|nr:class I SAM-dependent methyltransferase [Sphingomonas sp. KRR8]URD60648.1 methyltransferase domain-containing protein [Sphingomonas sp. KRR8]